MAGDGLDEIVAGDREELVRVMQVTVVVVRGTSRSSAAADGRAPPSTPPPPGCSRDHRGRAARAIEET